MENIISAIAASITLLKLSRDEVARYQIKKRLREDLLSALSKELNDVLREFDLLSEIEQKKLFVSIKAVESTPTPNQINEVVDSISDIQTIYSQIILSYVALSEACKEVSGKNPAFMKQLMEFNPTIHDFIFQTGELVIKKDHIEVGEEFSRFMMIHKRELCKDIRSEDIEKIVKEARCYIKIVKARIKPSIRKGILRRRTERKFMESFRSLERASKKFKVPKAVATDLRRHIPNQFLPIVTLIEEVFPFRVESDQSRFGPKTRPSITRPKPGKM